MISGFSAKIIACPVFRSMVAVADWSRALALATAALAVLAAFVSCGKLNNVHRDASHLDATEDVENFASSKHHPKNPFNASTNANPPFFVASSDRSEFLSYMGLVKENILKIDRLAEALEHLNAEPLATKDISKLYEYVRDRHYFPNSTGSLLPGLSQPSNEPPAHQSHSKQGSSNSLLCIDTSNASLSTGTSNRLSGEHKRRLPWHYPDDGCMLRAEFMSTWAADVLDLKPRSIHKIFLFGDLHVRTGYDEPEKGSTKWVYHVAPLVKNTKGEFVVLDPSLSYDKPIFLKSWIEMQTGGNPAASKEDDGRISPGDYAKNDAIIGFVIANRYVYNAKDTCDSRQSRFSLERILFNLGAFGKDLKWIGRLLHDEWARLADLGLSPSSLLGTY